MKFITKPLQIIIIIIQVLCLKKGLGPEEAVYNHLSNDMLIWWCKTFVVDVLTCQTKSVMTIELVLDFKKKEAIHFQVWHLTNWSAFCAVKTSGSAPKSNLGPIPERYSICL